jgi:predicted nucleic acid-binding protein
MTTALIDTNVLIYLMDVQDLAKQSKAQETLDALESSQAGRLSVQNLAEFFHVATRRLKPPLTPTEALAQIELFQRMWPVFNLTPLVVLEAGRGVRDHQLAYYDAQLWATARLNQIPLILSEDFKSGHALEGVRFVNPFMDGFQLSDWL